MNIQHTIVAITLLLAAAYTVWRIRRTFIETRSGCYGCKGCAIKEQMMKKNAKTNAKTKKFECFAKKNGKTFGG